MRLDQLPPLPPGAIGWQVYVLGGGNIDPYIPPSGEPVFAEFVADEKAVSRAAADFADEVAAYEPPESAR